MRWSIGKLGDISVIIVLASYVRIIEYSCTSTSGTEEIRKKNCERINSCLLINTQWLQILKNEVARVSVFT